MPTAFNVIATLIAKPGQQATLETLLRGLLEPTRLEAGCEQYDLHQDLQHPETFYMLERWSDDAALADHDQSAHIQSFRAKAADVIEHFELKRLKFLAYSRLTLFSGDIMKAIAYYASLPINDPNALQDIELPAPVAGPRDLLVEVKAISVNPVDTKVRQNVAPEKGAAKVLGWDVAGVVKAVGSDVTLFKAGDNVFYAGSLVRPGGNSELHTVDERIVGHMPKSLGFAEAAALPLTAITAWELLFERLQVQEGQQDNGQSLLIVGAAGGVGSILTQLASQLTGLKVIGTASRPETQEWTKALGADLVIDHSQPLSDALKAAGHPQVTHVASLTQTDHHLDQLVEALQPQGKLALIDDPKTLDVSKLKRKSLSLHWEFMYTRSMFETPDMIEQHNLLNRVAELIDAGTLKTTVGEHFGAINAANLRRAHALLESGKAKGKIVLEGF